jgi:tetratricopeptide (TPR) repeat protein
MGRHIVITMLSLIVAAHSAWAGMSVEEMKEWQQRLIEREITKLEHKRELASSAAAAFQQKDYSQAENLLSDLLHLQQLEPNERAEALTLRAAAFAHQGVFPRALQDADEAIRQDPKQAGAYLIRSIIYEKEGRKEQAIADLETYLGYAPKDQEALARLQQLNGVTSTPPTASTQPPSPPPGPKPIPPAIAATPPATTAAAPPPSSVELIAPIAGTWRTSATIEGAQVEALAMLDPNGNFNRFERWSFGLTVQIWGTYTVSPISATQLHMSQTPIGWDPKEWCVDGSRCTPLNYPVSATQFTFIDPNTVRDETTQATYRRQ